MADQKKFGAPIECPEFRKYWDLFLPKVIERENFHESHLRQLEILCNLYLDYNKLKIFIDENGYSFITVGRYGETSREHVEAKMMTKVLAEIRAYSKLLGLVLAKDSGKNGNDDGEWD